MPLRGSRTQEPTDNRLTVEAAFDKYTADAEARQLGPAARYKYKLLAKQMKSFAADHGIRYLEEFDLNQLRDFRATWRNRNLSAKKKLEQLRGFFRFCAKGGGLKANPALELDAPIVKQMPTLPFERNEMAQILHACDRLYTDNYGRVGNANAKRIKALVLLLRYSGLRISDGVTLPVSRIMQGKVFLRTAKTGTHVICPLPPLALDALLDCPRTNPLYFFWTGQCLRGIFGGGRYPPMAVSECACEKCGHSWTADSPVLRKACPRCGSDRWDADFLFEKALRGEGLNEEEIDRL